MSEFELQKEMATHLAKTQYFCLEIPWVEEPGGL